MRPWANEAINSFTVNSAVKRLKPPVPWRPKLILLSDEQFQKNLELAGRFNRDVMAKNEQHRYRAFWEKPKEGPQKQYK